MIELICSINLPPVDSGNVRRISSEWKKVRVDKIMLVYNGVYRARLSNQKDDAPHHDHMWAYFQKKMNKHAKLPVLKAERQEVDV